ncbi:Lrp/AsnC family transcriptional regulator [Clostridium sp. cel8]|jgi:Lrp/AsnC family transcriptional regulator, leucine-responsive regulatory protein|uniref:Lrp/AsnC family transcriptional regulator n=1 Tax=unclassified Clostridium TaxID=2614128 RepID=UPI0015F6E5A0|nr:Lrp/AsnC family transcriptional regulator [Clostridium sp. cel8]MBA5849904.1 Lrp/AsnC family transcriptional regulator [Clostridium sp. cel8]
MDYIDYKILKYLKLNARIKASEISRQIHMSVSAVLERIRKMEANGIIKNYTIVLDENKIGNTTSALMEVSLDHPKFYESFSNAVKNNNNISFCYYVTGDFDFILKIICKSPKELEEIHYKIKNIKGVSKTKTYCILNNIKYDN